jgi:hypothetical protein
MSLSRVIFSQIYHLTKLLIPQVFHLLIVNFLQWICHPLCTGKMVFQYQVLIAAYPFGLFSMHICLEAILTLIFVYNFIELCDAPVANETPLL